MGMKRLGAVLFDKDGTLIDFVSQWMPAYRAGAHHLSALAGQPDKDEDLMRIAGYDALAGKLDPQSPLACGTTRQIVSLWGEELRIPVDQRLIDEVEKIFHHHATQNPLPVTDLLGLFGRLRERGLKIGVATMDSTATAQANLEAFGVDHLVDYVAGYDRGHGVKPEPGMVREFCASAGVEAHETVVVGDAVLDLLMGRNAGAGMVVGVLSGVTPRETLARLADAVIESIAELENLLDTAVV
jgi:phosphoglycolate phosphatase